MLRRTALRNSLALLGCALTLMTTAPARGRVAMEPLRDVLQRATGDLHECRARFALPDGTYGVRFRIDPLGKVEGFELRRSPASISRPASACIEAAFSRLRFPAQREPEVRRRARDLPGRSVPPARRRAHGQVSISWPFVLASQTTDS